MSDEAKPARRILDVPTAAEYLGLTVWSLRWYVRKGKIPHRKLGAKIIFDIRELELWFSKLPGVTPTEARRAS